MGQSYDSYDLGQLNIDIYCSLEQDNLTLRWQKILTERFSTLGAQDIEELSGIPGELGLGQIGLSLRG